MATIILAGGLSTRMGSDKASLVLGDSTFLQELVSRFAGVLGTVLVVARPEQRLAPKHATVVTDVYVGCGPLGGLHAGLQASPDDENFVLACDMPLADLIAARYLVDRLPQHDAVVPLLSHRHEPLHAAYRKSCLPQIETNLQAGKFRIRDLLDQINTLYVTEDDLKNLGADLRSFTNINTPEEYVNASLS